MESYKKSQKYLNINLKIMSVILQTLFFYLTDFMFWINLQSNSYYLPIRKTVCD